MIWEGAQAGNVMPQNMWAVINFRLACHDSIDTLLAIMVGGIVYLILIFTLKAITLAEVETMPGGTKLVKILRKFVK